MATFTHLLNFDWIPSSRHSHWRLAPWRLGRVLAAACVAVCIQPAAKASAAWPEKTVRIISSSAAGGPGDEVARLLAAGLLPLTGGTFVVENRPGAASNIAMTAVARAEPDGYTFLIAPSSLTVNPAISAKVSFDPEKDFEPLVLAVTSPVLFAVPTSLKVSSVAEFVALAKREPNTLNYSSPGVGSSAHLAVEFLKLRAGINIAHVPHGGAAPAFQALLTNTVQLASSALQSGQGLVQDGAIVGIAVTSEKRWAELPKVPTLKELGYDDYAGDTFFALLAPAKTPGEINDVMVRHSIAILQRPETIARLRLGGMEVVAGGPEMLRDRIKREVPFWKDLVAKAGLKAKQ